MSQPTPGASGRVTVDRAALAAQRSDLAKARELAARLQREVAEQAAFARRAAEETLRAREEREEYRRVLAAAVTNERRSAEEGAAARADLERIEAALREAVAARGEAQGRARELEQRLAAVEAEQRRVLERVEGRAWAAEEEHRRERQRLEYERGVSSGTIRELRGRLPGERPASARVAEQRARAALVGSVVLLVLAVLLVDDTLEALASGEAGPLALAPLPLTLLEVGLLVGGLALLTFGLRELRRGEAASAAAFATDPGAPTTAPTGSGRGTLVPAPRGGPAASGRDAGAARGAGGAGDPGGAAEARGEDGGRDAQDKEQAGTPA